jgi:uracil-DNA glycosylase
MGEGFRIDYALPGESPMPQSTSTARLPSTHFSSTSSDGHKTMTSSRVWQQYLHSLETTGVTHLPLVRLATPSTGQKSRSGGPAQPVSAATNLRRAGSTLRSPTELQPESIQVPLMLDETSRILDLPLTGAEQKSAALCQLADVVADCKRCTELAETRTQTVFGVGNPDAQIMFIGEAPGAEEDQQGEPFVGRAGKLLNKIIEASTLKRENIYICNILRCRPPGNRNPRPQESTNCREFLDAQIKIVNPDYIVCWGTIAARNLLNEKQTIGKLRGAFHHHDNAKVLCTYHPSYLLRNPSAKKDVWDDMKILMKDLGKEL